VADAYINDSDVNTTNSMPKIDFLSTMRAYHDAYAVKLTGIRMSGLENFLVSYCRHSVAVKRDIRNSDIFFVYDSSYRRRFKKRNGNPTKVKAEYLNGYLKSVFATNNSPPRLDIDVAGFNFDRRTQSKKLTPKL